MGLFDTIQLNEALPCYTCKDESLQSFQTKDLDPCGQLYYFPGGYPFPDIYGGRKSWRKNPSPLSIVELCRECNTRWDGELYINYDKEDDVFLSDHMEIWPGEEKLGLESLAREHEFYDVSVSDGNIKIVPKIEKAIELYRRIADEKISKAGTYRSLLKSMSDARVPSKEIMGFVDEDLKSLTKEINYRNDLAKATTELDQSLKIAIRNDSGLRAALIILHNYDDQTALTLANEAGLKNFDSDIAHSRWYFGEEPKDPVTKFIGIIDGPNSYLRRLKN